VAAGQGVPSPGAPTALLILGLGLLVAAGASAWLGTAAARKG